MDIKKVKMINSPGLKNWLDALDAYPELQIILEECSPNMIDIINLVPDLQDKNRVKVSSFYGVLHCEYDVIEKKVLFVEGEHFIYGKGLIKKTIYLCPECQNPMDFDMLEEELFQFAT